MTASEAANRIWALWAQYYQNPESPFSSAEILRRSVEAINEVSASKEIGESNGTEETRVV